jgi:hypothetical protein
MLGPFPLCSDQLYGLELFKQGPQHGVKLGVELLLRWFAHVGLREFLCKK